MGAVYEDLATTPVGACAAHHVARGIGIGGVGVGAVGVVVAAVDVPSRDVDDGCEGVRRRARGRWRACGVS